MGSVTGVELGPESCVVVRVRRAGGRAELSAVRGLRDDDWDGGRPLAENLAELRRRERLPRTARVVAWGLHDPATATDLGDAGDPVASTTRTLVSPVREAGFEVESVMSPAQALALLARRRPRPAGRGGAVWLALNRQGAAIAIVDAGELLYSREFNWHYRPATTVKQELLQRYSLVAHLAPEVRHGLDIVGAQRGVAIGSVVTCGDLPDLRSLTMPLIEELDIEVETLDTLEGMDVSRLGDRDDLTERASALCLAATVGAGEPSGSRATRLRPWLAAAAAAAVLVLGGWLASGTFRSLPRLPPAAAPVVPRATEPVPSQTRSAPEPPPSAAAAAVAERRDAPPTAPPQEVPRPAATSGRQEAPLPAEMPAPVATSPTRHVPPPSAPVSRDERDPAVTGRVRPVETAPRPLTAPLPQVNSILVAPDRRLAVVGGEIVREGDAVGPRVLLRIEPDAVILREPSGHEVRVPIRRKLS